MTRPYQPDRPYIGITGFTSAAQVQDALALFPSSSDRRLMVGVLASRRTCAGLPERMPKRHPDVDAIAGVFQDHPLALNLIHYYTDEPATLGSQLAALVERAGPSLDGLQINGHWPLRSDLERIRSARPGLRLVLQVNPASHGNAPREVAVQVREVAGLADDVLLDASAGQGRPVDPESALPYLEALEDSGLGLGVAGGLCVENLPLIEPLLARFPGLSFDAESRLRDAEDRLDPSKVREYVETALRLVSGS